MAHVFHGGLDDITIWDKHLEDNHIREIMNLDLYGIKR